MTNSWPFSGIDSSNDAIYYWSNSHYHVGKRRERATTEYLVCWDGLSSTEDKKDCEQIKEFRRAPSDSYGDADGGCQAQVTSGAPSVEDSGLLILTDTVDRFDTVNPNCIDICCLRSSDTAVFAANRILPTFLKCITMFMSSS